MTLSSTLPRPSRSGCIVQLPSNASQVSSPASRARRRRCSTRQRPTRKSKSRALEVSVMGSPFCDGMGSTATSSRPNMTRHVMFLETAMKASRLLSILMLLQARGRMTAAALARATEVSERTILRDIDQLSAAGVPLWGERGRQGGFQLREGWSTRLTGMTEAEAGALLLAGLPGPATELGLGAAAASARLKMIASLPSGWREQA